MTPRCPPERLGKHCLEMGALVWRNMSRSVLDMFEHL